MVLFLHPLHHSSSITLSVPHIGDRPPVIPPKFHCIDSSSAPLLDVPVTSTLRLGTLDLAALDWRAMRRYSSLRMVARLVSEVNPTAGAITHHDLPPPAARRRDRSGSKSSTCAVAPAASATPLIATGQLKAWLDGRLFSAILNDCGLRQRGRSGAIGGNIQRDVSSILTIEKCIPSLGNTGHYFEQIADDCRWLCVFKGKHLYHLDILYHQRHQFDVLLSLGIAVSGNVVLRCRESPSIAEKNRPS